MGMALSVCILFLALNFVQCTELHPDASQRTAGQQVAMAQNDIADLLDSTGSHPRYRYSNGNSSDILPECDSFVREFGERASHFIKCSVSNARPFRFCERCVVHYKKAKTVFTDITLDDEKQGNCRRQLLDADRVQVISSIQHDIENIWKTADCDRCFDEGSISEDANGNVTYSLTEGTKEFLEAFSNFSDCIPPPVNRTHNQTVCDVCLGYYKWMNRLFNSFLTEDSTPQHVCMDIVDMMNYTRQLWGSDLKCRPVHRSFTTVILVAFGILCLPIVFYIVLAVYGTKKTRKIMTQKRLLVSTTTYGTLDSPALFTEETDRQLEDAVFPHDSSNHTACNNDLLHRNA